MKEEVFLYSHTNIRREKSNMMHKVKLILVILSIFLVLLLTACEGGIGAEKDSGTENAESNIAQIESDTEEKESGNNTEENSAVIENSRVIIHRYDWSGYGLGTKVIEECDMSDHLSRALSETELTGNIAPAVSSEPFDKNADGFPVERGTVWLEIGERIYRATPDLSKIYLVDGHFGEGRELDVSDEIKRAIGDALSYHPYDYYVGTYRSGDGTTSLEHKYEAQSRLDLKIVSMTLSGKSYGGYDNIVIEVTAKEDGVYEIHADSYQSDDNLGSFEICELALKKGETATATFDLFGWGSRYFIRIRADNTQIELTVEP